MQYIDIQKEIISIGKIIIKTKNYHILCLDAYDLYEWGMSEKLFVNCFKWKKFHWFNKEFIKNYDEDSDKGYILEVDVEYPRNLYNLHSDLPFYQKE